MNILDVTEHIRILEELLLHQDFTNSPERLDAMLSDDFREISPAGEIVSRASVIQWILNKDQASRWQFNHFEVKELAPGLAQAIYHARQIAPLDTQTKTSGLSAGAIHNSLWQVNRPGKSWQLMFHQSTRVK